MSQSSWIYGTPKSPEEEPPKDKDTPVSEGEDILAKYKELYLQNEDMVGWIAIDGTSINYPVMQSKNIPNFYLKHSFENLLVMAVNLKAAKNRCSQKDDSGGDTGKYDEM